MFESTRNWLKRNRTNFAIGAGVLGAGYLAGQYVLGKVTEARQRLSDDRIARENLRRRFEQNQEDCTYTVLALLPTATENVLKAIPVETILQELQHRKQDKGTRSTQGSEIAPSEAQSTTDDDGRSFASSNYVHASQMNVSGGDVRRSANVANIIGKKSKLQLWNELKISYQATTRAFTLIYTLSLLTLLTRVQLNLLGRRTYLSSVVSLASPPQDDSRISLENRDDDNLEQDYGNDFETNRQYLTFSWWLLHRGWTMIMCEVELAVKDIFGPLTPRDNVTFESLSELVLQIRKKIEGSSEEDRRMHKWLQYLLPTRSEEEMVLRESGMSQSSPPGTPPAEPNPVISPSLRRLLDETSDLVESPTFTHILTLILDSSFSLLVDEKVASQAYKVSTDEQRSSAVSNSSILKDAAGATSTSASQIRELKNEDATFPSIELRQRTGKLAAILAVFTREAHLIGSGGNLNTLIGGSNLEIPDFAAPMRESNEYLNTIEAIGDVEAFAAVVYSSNFEFEAVEGYNGIRAPIEAGGKASVMPDQSLEKAWDEALVR